MCVSAKLCGFLEGVGEKGLLTRPKFTYWGFIFKGLSSH